MLALDDLASTFQLVVREERDALTVSYKSRTVVLTPDQAIASVSGRLISLPAPPIRLAGKLAGADRLHQPRAAADLRPASRASPSVASADRRRSAGPARHGPLRTDRAVGARVTVESTPRATPSLTQDGNQRLTVKFDADAIDVALPSDVVPGFIQGYRSVDATSFAIDLGPRFGLVRTSTQIVDASTRLILELLPSATDNAPLPPATAPAPSPQQGEPAPPELPDIRTTSQLRTLAIDAGHGGDDVGAKGAGGHDREGCDAGDRAAAEGRGRSAPRPARHHDARGRPRRAGRPIAARSRTTTRRTCSSACTRTHRSAARCPAPPSYVASFDQAASQPRHAARRSGCRRLAAGSAIIELVPWNLAQIRYQRSVGRARAVRDRAVSRPRAARRRVRSSTRRCASSSRPTCRRCSSKSAT